MWKNESSCIPLKAQGLTDDIIADGSPGHGKHNCAFAIWEMLRKTVGGVLLPAVC